MKLSRICQEKVAYDDKSTASSLGRGLSEINICNKTRVITGNSEGKASRRVSLLRVTRLRKVKNGVLVYIWFGK